MIVSPRRIKLTSCLALGLVAFWSLADAVPRGLPSGGQEARIWIEEGKKLYENGDYEEAVRTLLEALKKTKAGASVADARFYLALSYYALGKTEDSRNQLEALFLIQPGRTIDESLFAEGFVELYNRVRPAAPASEPTAPRVAAREAPKGGGGKKFPWLVVGGAPPRPAWRPSFSSARRKRRPACPRPAPSPSLPILSALRFSWTARTPDSGRTARFPTSIREVMSFGSTWRTMGVGKDKSA
jgi:hypothetical protein